MVVELKNNGDGTCLVGGAEVGIIIPSGTADVLVSAGVSVLLELEVNPKGVGDGALSLCKIGSSDGLKVDSILGGPKLSMGEFVIGNESALPEILRTTGESDEAFATDGITNCDGTVIVLSTLELSTPVSNSKVGARVGLGDGTFVGIRFNVESGSAVVFTFINVLILLLVTEVGMTLENGMEVNSGCTSGLDVGNIVGMLLISLANPDLDELEVLLLSKGITVNLELFSTEPKADDVSNVGRSVGMDSGTGDEVTVAPESGIFEQLA